MNYLIADRMVDTSNFKNPTTGIIQSDNLNSEANSWSRMKIYFKQININTDSGFFLENIENQSTIGIDSIKTESFYSPNTDTIFSHIIQHSEWLEVYQREYIKVQDVFAMMGGFINFSLLVLRFLISYISKPQIIDIFNKNYRYVLTNQEKKGNLVNPDSNLYVNANKSYKQVKFIIYKYLSFLEPDFYERKSNQTNSIE
jgi:hypothetical protein